MKKTVMMMALLAGVLLAASCEKVGNEAQQTGFTLTATIAGSAPETKTTYADPGDGSLTVGWEDDEKLSLLICDPTDGIVKNYVLTGTKVDDKNCDFSTSETIDALTGGQYYLCVYPALVKETSSGYESETRTLVYLNSSKELRYEGAGTKHFLQDGAASPDHIKNGDLLIGTPVISGSNAEVELERQVGVLKMVVKLPAKYATGGTDPKAFIMGGFGDMTETYAGFAGALKIDDWSSASFVLKEGNGGAYIMFKSAIVVPASAELVLYVPVGPCTVPAGKYTFAFMSGEESGIMSDSITSPEDLIIEKNKMTTLAVDLSEVTWVSL